MTAYHEMNQASDSGNLSMQIDDTDAITAHLGGMAAAGSSSERVADSVGSILRDIEQVLEPIVGQRGAAALYKRSVHLAKGSFPWLPDAQAGAPSAMDVGLLTAALAARTAGDAALGGAGVIRAFHALLTNLIGPSLTERLLRPVWVPFLSSPPAQDNTQ